MGERRLRDGIVWLRTWLFTVPLIVAATALLATVSFLVSFWDPTGRAQNRIARAWSRTLLAIGGVQVQVDGLEKLDPRGRYVLAANHSSYFDTPAILASIPLEFRFFAKEHLFRLPFLGWHLRRAGHFPVMADARGSLKSMVEAARQMNERGFSLLLFPEGGRSLERLREFREGAAHMAIRAGVPLVPLGITGARAILPMHGKRIRSGTIRIQIADPVETEGFRARDRDRLTRETMERVAGMVNEPIPTLTKEGM